MFSFRKKDDASTATLKISGMHCTSCAMNIDGALEDTKGVSRSETDYARSITKVTFDKNVVSEQQLENVIKEQGYEVVK